MSMSKQNGIHHLFNQLILRGGMKVVKSEFTLSDVVQVLCGFSKWCLQSFIFPFAGITYRFNDSTRIEEALKNQDIDNDNDILGYAPIQKIVRGGVGGSEGYLCLPEGS